MEDIYTEAHKQIRESPEAQPKERSDADKKAYRDASKKYYKPKLTYDERKQRVQEKISAFRSGDLEA
jgi:large subunit ribosomal protein L5e